MVKKQNITLIFIILLVVSIIAFTGFKFIEKLSKDEVDDKINPKKDPLPGEDDPPIVDPPVCDDCGTVEPEDPVQPPGADVECESESVGRFLQIWVRQDNPVDPSKPTGFFKGNLEVVVEFQNTGKCKSKFYIESGIVNQPESIVTLRFAPTIRKNIGEFGEDSACDGNVHYNGVIVVLEPLQRVVVLMEPENYGVEAKYPVNVVAGTGCLKDGGVIVKNEFGESEGYIYTVFFSDKFSAFDIDNSWVGFETN